MFAAKIIQLLMHLLLNGVSGTFCGFLGRLLWENHDWYERKYGAFLMHVSEGMH